MMLSETSHRTPFLTSNRFLQLFAPVLPLAQDSGLMLWLPVYCRSLGTMLVMSGTLPPAMMFSDMPSTRLLRTLKGPAAVLIQIAWESSPASQSHQPGRWHSMIET